MSTALKVTLMRRDADNTSEPSNIEPWMQEVPPPCSVGNRISAVGHQVVATPRHIRDLLDEPMSQSRSHGPPATAPSGCFSETFQDAAFVAARLRPARLGRHWPSLGAAATHTDRTYRLGPGRRRGRSACGQVASVRSWGRLPNAHSKPIHGSHSNPAKGTTQESNPGGPSHELCGLCFKA